LGLAMAFSKWMAQASYRLKNKNKNNDLTDYDVIPINQTI